MKRNSISFFALFGVLGMFACSSEEPSDGSIRGELRIANISFTDGHSEREFFLAPEGSEELTRLVFPTTPEIAALTGCPVGSIGPTRARALQRLSRVLADAA